MVFANKQPAAWATLVSALIRAGFVVDASWPIQTERESKVAGGARLSSSIWLVCRKRPAAARPGWDNQVLADMQANVAGRLRAFWDAYVRGPDFFWAATGPALEAFSRHPVVRKADEAGERLTVEEFLRRVRRLVVGFVVSRLFDEDEGAAGELDDPATYYLATGVAARLMKVRDVTQRIGSDGWYYVKSHGDHHQFTHPTKPGKVTVRGRPGDEIGRALLASIWRQAGLRKPEE